MTTRTATLIGGAMVAGTIAAGVYVLRRRKAGGEDRLAADAATAAVVEPSARGHSEEPTQRPAPVRPTDAAAPTPDEALAEPEHDPPAGAVMADTSSGDPLVDEQTDAARAQAASIGGELSEDEPAADASGDAAETFEAGAGEPGREKPA